MNSFIVDMPSWLSQPQCEVDPYLRVAFATQFQDYDLESFKNNGSIPILIESEKRGIEHVVKLIKTDSANRLDKPRAITNFPVFTAHTTKATIERLHQSEHVKRIELAMPLRVQRPATHAYTKTVNSVSNLKSKGTTLIGVIDSGCPFAHQTFRLDSGTRVHAIWDQDDIFNRAAAPKGFSYGRLLNKSQLDAWITKSRTHAGIVDENWCYVQSGLGFLQTARSHGAHVLGLVAGNYIYRSIGLASKPNGQRFQTDVGKMRLNDIASESDIVFVQLPKSTIQAPTCGSMSMHLLNGLLFVVENAGPLVEEIYVVIDYGSYLGPHDGTSLFERAVDDLVKRVREEKGKQLHVLFAAGNGRQHRFHAGMRLAETKDRELELWMPPANEVPVFAELWLQAGTQISKIELKTPNRKDSLANAELMKKTSCLGDLDSPIAVIDVSRNRDGQICALIRISPTRTDSNKKTPAPDGRWLLRVKGKSKNTAHLYVTRGGKNFGVYKRAFQSQWKIPSKSISDVSKTLWIDTKHTTIGAGCGNETIMVGSYQSWDRKPTKYSGRGPRRGGKFANIGPQYLVVGEEAQSLRGIRGISNRSGASFRMVGTSTAPPQAVRTLMKPKKSALRSPSTAKTDRPIDDLVDGADYL